MLAELDTQHADDTGAATRDDTTAERVDAPAGYADADDGLSVDAGVGVAA